MASMSNWMTNAVIDHFFRGQTLTLPTNLYVALFSSDPTAAGTGTELSGNGYARVPITRSLVAWSATQGSFATTVSTGTTGTTSNNEPIAFPAATAAWPSITHAAVYDAPAGGNLWVFGQLSSPASVALNDVKEFPAGELRLAFS